MLPQLSLTRALLIESGSTSSSSAATASTRAGLNVLKAAGLQKALHMGLGTCCWCCQLVGVELGQKPKRCTYVY